MFLKILKYSLYGTGIFLVFGSFLFFARAMNTYNNLLLVGLVLSAIGLSLIIFGKSSKKERITLLGLTVLLMFCQYITEPFLINSSYRIYFSEHRSDLEQMNSILSNSEHTTYFFDDENNQGLSEPEFETVKRLKAQTGVQFISVSQDKIYYKFGVE